MMDSLLNTLAKSLSYTHLHKKLFELYQSTQHSPKPETAATLGSLRVISEEAQAEPDTAKIQLIQCYQRLIELSLARESDAPAQSKPELPVVVTSLNPFSRAELQVRCFKKWLSLGFKVYTLNYGSEIAALNEIGIANENIIQLGIEETGDSLYGKPVPKIRAIANRAYANFEQDVLLVNSDLYPSASDASFIDIWREIGKPLGLTRQDVLSVDHPVRRIWQPYRGGIDAFLLSRQDLGKLRNEFALLPSSNRMCVGIVGWDYLVGALLIKRLGGTLIDSKLLYHEIHPTTYSNVDEFANYLPAMQALGYGVGQGHVETAHEFSETIDVTCQANLDADQYHKINAILRKERTVPHQSEHIEMLEEIAPQLLGSFGTFYVTSLANALNAREDIEFSDLIARFPDAETKRAFGHILLLFMLYIEAPKKSSLSLTQTYPKGNKHAAAVTVIRQNTVADPDLRRLEIAKLFCTEFADYGLFNPHLYNFLALSCENDGERALLSKIRQLISENMQNAA